MNTNKQNLKGSESRDIFKQLHKKKLGTGFYASDLDLCLVSKYPPGIVAFLDYKRPSDNVSFAEGILYNELKKIAPIYIVEASFNNGNIIGPFTVRQILEINWKPEPPIVKYYDDLPIFDAKVCNNWLEFKEWEIKIRKEYCIRQKSR